MMHKYRLALGGIGILGASIIGLLVIVAIVAPLFLSGAANLTSTAVGEEMSWSHPLGTNDFGQDILARTLVATRLTLVMSGLAVAIEMLGGIAIGLLVWAAPGRVREAAARFIETLVSFPHLVMALVVAAILGPGVTSAVLAIGIAGIPAIARLTINNARKIATADYYTTSRLLGVPGIRLAWRHLLPNMAEPMLLVSGTVFTIALIEISALSFVGLGVQSPQYDFGLLLNEGLHALYKQPAIALGASAMIVLAGAGMMLIGDAIAAHVDPRRRRAFSARPERPPRGNPSAAPEGKELLVCVRNLSIRLPGGPELIKGLSFDVHPGEILGLVGESGSGKSLTAMALAGLLPDTLSVAADTLWVDDMNMLVVQPGAKVAQRIGIVYQDPGTTFSPTLRIGTQLTEVLRCHMKLRRSEANAAISTALQSIGISEPEKRLRQRPHELSGGMRQRAMIASCLASSPKLIIADEPTTALDVTVQAEVLRELEELRRKLGTGILFISHDLGVVHDLCDRVLVMRSGEVVEEVRPSQIWSGDVQHPYTQMLLRAMPGRPRASAMP